MHNVMYIGRNTGASRHYMVSVWTGPVCHANICTIARIILHIRRQLVQPLGVADTCVTGGQMGLWMSRSVVVG